MENDEFELDDAGNIFIGSTKYTITEIIELLNIKGEVIIALRNCKDSYKDVVDLQKEKIECMERIIKLISAPQTPET